MTDTLMDYVPRIDGGPIELATFYGLVLICMFVGGWLAVSLCYDTDAVIDVVLAVDDCRDFREGE